jgi:hypothetical protein
MTIVDIRVIAANTFKISRGSKIESAVAFKQSLNGRGDFKRDIGRVGKRQIA